jgi:hypothetical protein
VVTVATDPSELPEVPSELTAALERYSEEFDEMVLERHRMGSKKYGPGKFLTVDTMEEALYELADLSNYARYTFIKIRLLQARIAQEDKPDFTKEMS